VEYASEGFQLYQDSTEFFRLSLAAVAGKPGSSVGAVYDSRELAIGESSAVIDRAFVGRTCRKRLQRRM